MLKQLKKNDGIFNIKTNNLKHSQIITMGNINDKNNFEVLWINFELFMNIGILKMLLKMDFYNQCVYIRV